MNQKQKAGTPNDPSIKKPKIPKLATPAANCSQYQLPLSQLFNSTQVIDPTSVMENDAFEQLAEIWKSAKKNELHIPQDPVQDQRNELKDHIAQANIEIKRLQEIFSNDKNENEKMSRIIEEKCKRRDEIIKGQNLITDFESQIQGHFDVIDDTYDHCQESGQHFVQLYNNLSLKQKEIIKNLTKQKDQISNRQKEFKDQLESKGAELSTMETKLMNFEKEINDKAQLKDVIPNKIEKSKIILDEIKKIRDQKIAQVLAINDEKKSTQKDVQEDKHKLEQEVNENLTKYEELFAKSASLEITKLEYKEKIADLTSSKLELNEEETGLNNELEKFNNIHLTLLSDKDLELAESRKQLQDCTLACEDASNELKKVTTNTEELSKTVAKMVEDNEHLEELLKNKDEEMMNIGINLKNVLDKNKEIDEKITTQNQDLIKTEKQISDIEEISKTRSAEQNETVKRQHGIVVELDMIDHQMCSESTEIEKLIEEKADRKFKFAERAKELKREMKEINELITREEETIADLKREMGQKQSKYQKKIQDASHASKQCQLLGHEKRLKEQNNKVDEMNRKLSDGKLKQKEANANKTLISVKEKENHDDKMNTMESKHRNLNEQLSKMKKEYEDLLKKSKEVKNTEPKIIPVCTTPKSILKSTTLESPLKVQKVKFDLGGSSNNIRSRMMERFEESKRRHDALPIGGPKRPDWKNLKIPKAPEEPDTTSSIQTQPEKLKGRKFFKSSRF